MDNTDLLQIVVDATLAISANAEDANAYFVRGRALYALGRNSEALSDIKKALALKPELMKQIQGEFKK